MPRSSACAQVADEVSKPWRGWRGQRQHSNNWPTLAMNSSTALNACRAITDWETKPLKEWSFHREALSEGSIPSRLSTVKSWLYGWRASLAVMLFSAPTFTLYRNKLHANNYIRSLERFRKTCWFRYHVACKTGGQKKDCNWGHQRKAWGNEWLLKTSWYVWCARWNAREWITQINCAILPHSEIYWSYSTSGVSNIIHLEWTMI